mmetsp:Transcript_24400/g.43315  ORF Transcript_24400/g.43315 Transcript_24400/m.43315 type:complete len:109 (-) Transcript_24400:543-869(-)
MNCSTKTSVEKSKASLCEHPPGPTRIGLQKLLLLNTSHTAAAMDQKNYAQPGRQCVIDRRANTDDLSKALEHYNTAGTKCSVCTLGHMEELGREHRAAVASHPTLESS